ADGGDRLVQVREPAAGLVALAFGLLGPCLQNRVLGPAGFLVLVVDRLFIGLEALQGRLPSTALFVLGPAPPLFGAQQGVVPSLLVLLVGAALLGAAAGLNAGTAFLVRPPGDGGAARVGVGRLGLGPCPLGGQPAQLAQQFPHAAGGEGDRHDATLKGHPVINSLIRILAASGSGRLRAGRWPAGRPGRAARSAPSRPPRTRGTPRPPRCRAFRPSGLAAPCRTPPVWCGRSSGTRRASLRRRRAGG